MKNIKWSRVIAKQESVVIAENKKLLKEIKAKAFNKTYDEMGWGVVEPSLKFYTADRVNRKLERLSLHDSDTTADIYRRLKAKLRLVESKIEAVEQVISYEGITKGEQLQIDRRDIRPNIKGGRELESKRLKQVAVDYFGAFLHTRLSDLGKLYDARKEITDLFDLIYDAVGAVDPRGHC